MSRGHDGLPIFKTDIEKDKLLEILDILFVEELFSNQLEFTAFVNGTDIDELPVIKTEMGEIIGGEEIHIESFKKFNSLGKMYQDAININDKK